MSILTVSNLTHGFGNREIFANVSFRLLKGEHIALIGANGEGKSTFMDIITFKLQPDEGEIEWAKNVRVGYLDQHSVLQKGLTIQNVLESAFDYLFELEAKATEMYGKMAEAPDDMDALLEETGIIQDLLTNNDFYNIDIKIKEVARGLGLLDMGLSKEVSELSGGQKTKVLLAKLLLQKPDILLLDEPTNYLDEIHINWIKRFLQEYENAFILISHDIPFMNDVINLVYHVENNQINRYVGDYDNFVKIREMKIKQQEAAYKRQQQEIRDLEDFVQRNKARVATRKMAMSRQKKLDKIEKIELTKEKPKPVFNFIKGRTSGKLVFEANDLIIGYEEPLSRPLNIKMERGEKIALVGANGLGKTTLIKSVLKQIKPLSGSVALGDNLDIGYFKQEEEGSMVQTCIESLWEEYPSYTQFEIRAALAKCGLTTEQIESKVGVLSGGEQSKLRLCKILNTETNTLFFDEPTNHLDQAAKEELQRALIDYKGSILLISHEPAFYQSIATKAWDCADWSTKG